jgi:hypothetical protein
MDGRRGGGQALSARPQNPTSARAPIGNNGGLILRRSLVIGALLLVIGLNSFAWAADQTTDPVELPVKVENGSTAVLCAEKDNVHLNFLSPIVRQFRVQAVHPAYIGTIASDRYQRLYAQIVLATEYGPISGRGPH